MYVDSNDKLYNMYLEQSPLLDNLPRDYMILNNFLNWFDAVVYNRIEARE